MQSRSLSIKDFSLTSQYAVARAFWIVTFALLTAAGAQIEIPHVPVPFTLQTFFVLVAAGVLGMRGGSFSMILYLLLGVLGFPVFSSGSFGIMKLLGPTGGYLLAFPVATVVIGAMLAHRKSLPWIAAAMCLGLLCVFAMGTTQLWIVSGTSFSAAFASGFLIFSWWDILKLAAAAAITNQVFKRSTPRV